MHSAMIREIGQFIAPDEVKIDQTMLLQIAVALIRVDLAVRSKTSEHRMGNLWRALTALTESNFGKDLSELNPKLRDIAQNITNHELSEFLKIITARDQNGKG